MKFKAGPGAGDITINGKTYKPANDIFEVPAEHTDTMRSHGHFEEGYVPPLPTDNREKAIADHELTKRVAALEKIVMGLVADKTPAVQAAASQTGSGSQEPAASVKGQQA